MIYRFKLSIIHPGGHTTEVRVPINEHSGALVRIEIVREIMQNITPQLPAGTEVYLTLKSKSDWYG